MRSRALGLAFALVLSRCHKVNAQDDGYHSFGQVSPCQNSHLTNATSFGASLTPDNYTLAFEFSGLSTVAGNATLGVAIEADGNEIYKATLDPCSFSMPDLCPASDGFANLSYINMNIPEDASDFANLSTRADVKARLYLNISGMDSNLHSTCLEIGLHSDANNDGDGSTSIGGNRSNQNGTTSSDDSSSANSSANGDSGDSGTSDATQVFGASTLQVAWCLALFPIALWHF